MGTISSLKPRVPVSAGGAGVPKKPPIAEYELSVDSVIEPGLVGREGKIMILVGAGNARLRLADGILAALRQMGGRPVLR